MAARLDGPTVLPTLQGEPALEDVLVERLSAPTSEPRAEARGCALCEGSAIERKSFSIIERRLNGEAPSDPGAAAIVRRVIHATADFSFADSMRVHPQAVERGTAALASGRPVICDVRMLAAGLTKVRGEVLCAIGDEDVAQRARAEGATRAAAAMDKLADRLDGAIVAIGNAPTALWRVIRIARGGGASPTVVVGLPVGFVGARESKLALIESGLCYVSNVTPRGGSPAAAAAVNALAALSDERSEQHA